MVAGPEKPACASAAACRPAHAAQPVWKRLVQEPSARNSIEPAAWLPAMPSAAASAAASSPSTAPAAAAPERCQPAAEDDARLFARAAERHAEMVAQQVERAREDVGRQRPVAHRDHLAAELLSEAHEDGSRAALTWRCQAAKRSSRSAAPRRGPHQRSRGQRAPRRPPPAPTPE